MSDVRGLFEAKPRPPLVIKGKVWLLVKFDEPADEAVVGVFATEEAMMDVAYDFIEDDEDFERFTDGAHDWLMAQEIEVKG